MADLIPPADNVEDSMARAAEAIRAMRHIPPNENAAQARVRACAAIAAQRELAEAARRTMTAAIATKQTNGNGHDNASAPFDRETLAALAQGLGDWLNPLLRDLEQRLDVLEKRKPGIAPLAAHIAGIEQRMLSYEGVWCEGKSYSRGSFVTHAGSLWFAEDGSIDARPGAGSSAWKLAVKKGHAER